jgi:hypothetical protein
VGEVIIRQSYRDENLSTFYIRLIFDVSCFLIVNICFLNMIFGIIIDTFAELRVMKVKTEYQKRNFCYVCSINRNLIEKSGVDFRAHIQKSHYLWNYLFLLYHIKKKPKTELNGIENYIIEQVDADRIDWFPIGQSKDFINDDEPKQSPVQVIEMIQSQLDKIADKINNKDV